MKNLFKIVLFIFLALSFNSCLEDEPITDYESIDPVVLIPNGNWPSVTSAIPVALDFKPQAQIIELYARVSWDKPLDKDVTVTFTKDPSIITAYNTTFGTTFTELPAAAYKLPSSLTLTIPAGQREAKLAVELFADKVDLAKNNMIAFRLSDGGGQNVASNFRQIVFPVLVKNSYEATYKVTGYFYHPTAGRGINMNKYLATISGTRCEAPLGDLGPSGWKYQFDVSGSSVSNWAGTGATPAAPASGFMTTDNPGAVSFASGYPVGDNTHANFPNTYDAGTKTFKFHYGYAGGSTGEAGYTRQIVEKWVRQ